METQIFSLTENHLGDFLGHSKSDDFEGFKTQYGDTMVLKIKKITDVIGRKVYTDTGDFFGEIEESNLVENKVESWRIRVAGSMANFLGGARGVIIPHQFVKAVGDIIIISRANLPMDEDHSAAEAVELSAGSQ